jgi:two-component system, OmpR family, phosphate regulon sensor histidine kinase PhoR
VALTRTQLLGDALSTLSVQRTPTGRRRIIVRAQMPFVVLFTIVLAAILIAGAPMDAIGSVVGAWLGIVVMTVLGFFVPWERFAEATGVVIAGIDLVAVAVVSSPLERDYPTLIILQLLPVVILAFAFGRVGFIVSVLGSFLVSLVPLIVNGALPDTARQWTSVLLTPFTIVLVAGAVQYFSRILQRTQMRLRESTLLAENGRSIIETVINTLDVGTAFVRTDDSLAFVNNAYRTLVARAEIDPVTRSGTKVFDTDRTTPVPPAEQMMEQAKRGDYFESRLYWVGDPGDQRAVLVTARPVIRHDGEHIGSAFVSKDVTELTDAIRGREDFLAGVSHELRTPLTSIIGYLEVIDDSIDAEATGISRELGIIQRNANQLLMRIGDLLHVTDDNLSLRTTPVDVPRVVQQSVDAIRFRAENAGVDLSLHSTEPFVASIDQGRIAQVLDNLLTNAVKYTPRGGSVDVRLCSRDGEFEVTVSDTGTGIKAAELKRVFERFYRAESVRGTAISGVGLGLSIVRGITEAHEGTVNVASTIGEGTTFTVTIPKGV